MEKGRVDYIVAHYIGNIYLYHKQDYAQAAAWYAKSARYSEPMDPRYSAVALMYEALSQTLTDSAGQRGWQLAAKRLERAVSLDPMNLEARYQYAQCLANLGDAERALDTIEYLIDRDCRYITKVLLEEDFLTFSRRHCHVVLLDSQKFCKNH